VNRPKRPKGNVKRGTRAFRAIRREYLDALPGGWQEWVCPICRRGVTREADIHLDHLDPVWLADPGDRTGIDAQQLRSSCRLICGPCNTTRGRGRSDKRVATLRARKLRQASRTNKPTPNTVSRWTLAPKRKDSE